MILSDLDSKIFGYFNALSLWFFLWKNFCILISDWLHRTAMVFRDLFDIYKLRVSPAKAWLRGFIFCHKKENTWCDMLVELCSQIKYSPSPFLDRAGSGIDGISYITDRDGNPNVFKLKRNEGGLWLNDNWANSDNHWNPDNEFVFALRKYSLFRAIRCGFSFPGSRGFFSNRQAFCRFLAVSRRYLRIACLILIFHPM